MTTPNTDIKNDTELNKEFWDSLQTEILKSNYDFTNEDIFFFVEKNFMFSLFFRGTSYKELRISQTILDLKDLGYLILLEFIPIDNTGVIDFDLDELELHYFIKNTLNDVSNAIGPMIENHISVLITDNPDVLALGQDTKTSSMSIAKRLIIELQKKYKIDVKAGIGSVQSIHSIYTSFFEAMSCMHHCNPGEAFHVQDFDKSENKYNFEYKDTEKYMINAIRHRKSEAYDYFSMLMNKIKPKSDNEKRNRIIEALVMVAHSVRIDGMNEADYFNYTAYFSTIMELKGNQLIEWAFQKFIDITGIVKPHSAIDYSNKIVLATKKYLEAHYAEEISLEDVAEHVNISPQYFSKLIKKNTGFNFIDWLSMLRVKRAKELLTNSNLTVKEVCFMVGYKDPNYFSRIFKKKIGMTPSEYIKNQNKISS